ncbi:hypothetical protein [Streptomyces sp. B93]|uniref:hypothetical protein n=1 Tax=Streptomyces sp. B93 TaxID=2824875 RepID=UPI001B36699A|nr:hypothetical protein [Streptomyces sp. B93]MBQ1093287.1 hypothetical protein [Streptomyces sp. B93]
MPTPYGSRGGMAFGVEELQVLRRALALALHPGRPSAEDVQDCLSLAESLDEAAREGARLRAFLVADLARYRAALPGTAVGYLALLEEVLPTGYRPTPDDVSALRALRGNPRAAALLDRTVPTAAAPLAIPASRTPLHALPGGLATENPAEKPKPAKPADPAKKPAEKPVPARRPVPTPGEVFPRRKPPQRPAGPPQQLAAG